MTIIISKDGKDSEKIEKTDFMKEDKMQELIDNNIENLPFYDQDDENHLLSLGREFPTKHGPVDVLGVDASGVIYIIEAKLHKNHTRREILAQVIDYASAIWSEYKNFETFENAIAKYTNGIKLEQFIKNNSTFLRIEEDESNSIVDNVKQNIEKGDFKFVIVMDSLDEKLTNAVDFINSKMPFSIYPLTFDYYKHKEFEIIIPKIYGREAEKSSTNKSTSNRHVWNEDEFNKTVLNNPNFEDHERKSIYKIISFTKEMMSPNWQGTWHKYFQSTGKEPVFKGYLPMVSENRSLYLIEGETGNLKIQFWAFNKNNDRELLKKFLQKCRDNKFEKISNVFDERGKNSSMRIKKEEWMPNTDKFISILRESFSQ